MATNYDIDYNDERFAKVETDKQAALNEVDTTYGDMIGQTDAYYQQQMDAVREYGDTQSKIQQDNTDFAIEKIEQQKAQANKDYIKEQSGAYVDWQKQSNAYGVNDEKMAAAGLSGSGFSESAKVSMYNTYQNRVATARESYNQSVMNYNNAMTEARLQNNAILAEMAYETLQKQLELSLQGFQYKNTLVLEQANKKWEATQFYADEWQRVLNQMNTENALAEEIRQYNEQLAEEKRQYDSSLAEEKRQYDTDFAEEQRRFDVNFAEEKRQFDTSLAEEKRQHDESLSETKRQFDAKMEEQIREFEKEFGLQEGELKLALEKFAYQKEQDKKDNALKQSELKLAQDKFEYEKGQAKAENEELLELLLGGEAPDDTTVPDTHVAYGNATADKTAAEKISDIRQKSREEKAKVDKYPVDISSVLNLGFGKLSASDLDKLVRAGYVTEYVEGGKTKFKKAKAISKTALMKLLEEQ